MTFPHGNPTLHIESAAQSTRRRCSQSFGSESLCWPCPHHTECALLDRDLPFDAVIPGTTKRMRRG
jgi:hypothetical protein